MLGIGAARVPGAAPAALCIPLLTNCGTTQPTPTPTPSPTSIVTPPVGLGTPPGAGSTPGTATPPPVVAVPDPNAPTFTLPAAQLGGSSISFSGLRSVSVVTVPLADGTRTPVLKLVADDIVITDFLLDVRKATGPSLVSNATRMELRGNVQVYLDSATATLVDGTGISFGAATPPPGNELPPTLLRVNLGLVGVTANSISFTASHQAIHE
ncbi:MAG: hypothetical protein JWN09_1000 [Microbacteriaceae bacterium]|jgi:hypothetical protein|nr:hypothetical protein [Microbacteriaceae bacterium]